MALRMQLQRNPRSYNVLPCEQTKQNFVKSVYETWPKSLFCPPPPHPPPVYQDLRTRHDWPLKKAIVDLPIRLKGNSKRTSGNSLSLLGSHKTDLDATSQTLLTEVKLRLPHAQANLLSGQDKPP